MSGVVLVRAPEGHGPASACTASNAANADKAGMHARSAAPAGRPLGLASRAEVRPEPAFNLLRRFALASLAVIAAIALSAGILLYDFLAGQLIHSEARVTAEFVRNTLQVDGSTTYFVDPANRELARRFGESASHFGALAEVLRINVYSRERRVLWSTDPNMTGRRFGQNEELERALHGELVVEGGSISASDRSKAEHVGLNPASHFFFEIYIPVTMPGKAEIVGAVELYRAPADLTTAIKAGQVRIWLGAALGALALYLTLFWIVRSADRRIRDQHARLTKAETMAAVGELAASVAHNIRNPLASIRSSAELATAISCSVPCEQMNDIMASVDRIELWLRDLVNLGQAETAPQVRIDAAQLVEECCARAKPDFQRRGIEAKVTLGTQPAMVIADRALLEHVLHSLINNAIEATPRGGRITAQVSLQGKRVEIRMVDTGCGMSPEQLGRLFSLFFTTKPRGLGIGLTLARRAVERFGGTIRAESAVGVGTSMIIDLPEA